METTTLRDHVRWHAAFSDKERSGSPRYEKEEEINRISFKSILFLTPSSPCLVCVQQQLSLGKDIAKCVDAGHWAARVIIQESGCAYPKVCEYK